MPPLAQDIEKVLDLTGETSIAASQINQIVDTAVPATDKGFIVETTDSAADTPDPPDAAVTTKWKRYLWRRIHDAADANGDTVTLYYWDDTVTPDADLDYWVAFDANAAAALAAAQNAQTDATQALSYASQALGESITARDVANTARVTANQAAADVAAMETNVTDLLAKAILTGMVIPFGGATIYSTTTNEGWLECDGSMVAKTVFSALYALLGTTFGAETTDNFKLPDLRGRTIIGAGTGVGLTARTLAGEHGTETHQLQISEMPEHTHKYGEANLPNVQTAGGDAAMGEVVPPAEQWDSGSTGGGGAHQNMQPSTVLRWLIKT